MQYTSAELALWKSEFSRVRDSLYKLYSDVRCSLPSHVFCVALLEIYIRISLLENVKPEEVQEFLLGVATDYRREYEKENKQTT